MAGLTAAVAIDGRRVWSTALGVAGVSRPCRLDTQFEIASLTKPVVSLVLLRLVEAGQLDPREPIAPFVPPDSPFTRTVHSGPPVTVGDVWSHTSGLRLIPMNRKARLFPPRATFRYNGAAFGLLTHVVEQRRAQRIEIVVADLLAEAAMANSSPGPSTCSPPDAQTDYWRRPTRLARRLGRTVRRRPLGATPRWWERQLGTRAGPLNTAAGLVSNVPDMLALDRLIDTGQMMTDHAKQLAWTPTILADGTSAPYGKGWFVTSHRDERVVWHYGHRPGVNSSLWIKVPNRRSTFIVLANSSGISCAGLGHGHLDHAPVAQLALNSLIPP